MTRKFKALGLGGVAALALVALAVSSASATNPQFHSEVDHTTVAGAQEGTNTFTVNAGTVHCSTATFHGTSTQKTTNELTIAPNYQGCKITTGAEVLEATVDMNGCHYLFTPSGQVHLTCPAGAFIRVTAPLCNVTVHPQTIEKVDYKNTGAGATRSTTVESTATNIAYTQSSLCPGGGGSFGNGTYAGSVSTTCTDTVENHVGCWWSTE